MEIWEPFAKYAPQYLPIIGAIAVIIFTRTYVYKGMVPESMLKDQLAREDLRNTAQHDRELKIVDSARNVENRLEEIVRQLECLTKNLSDEVRSNTERLASLERFMSDFITEFNDLNHNFELHRKGVPPTEVYRKPRKESKEDTP